MSVISFHSFVFIEYSLCGPFIPNREQNARNRNGHIPAIKRITFPVLFYFDLIQVWLLRERGET